MRWGRVRSVRVVGREAPTEPLGGGWTVRPEGEVGTRDWAARVGLWGAGGRGGAPVARAGSSVGRVGAGEGSVGAPDGFGEGFEKVREVRSRIDLARFRG